MKYHFDSIYHWYLSIFLLRFVIWYDIVFWGFLDTSIRSDLGSCLHREWDHTPRYGPLRHGPVRVDYDCWYRSFDLWYPDILHSHMHCTHTWHHSIFYVILPGWHLVHVVMFVEGNYCVILVVLLFSICHIYEEIMLKFVLDRKQIFNSFSLFTLIHLDWVMINSN